MSMLLKPSYTSQESEVKVEDNQRTFDKLIKAASVKIDTKV